MSKLTRRQFLKMAGLAASLPMLPKITIGDGPQDNKLPFFYHDTNICFPSRHSVKKMKHLPAFVEAMGDHLTKQKAMIHNWVNSTDPEMPSLDELFSTSFFALVDGLALMMFLVEQHPEVSEGLRGKMVDGTLFDCAAIATPPWPDEGMRQSYIADVLQGHTPPAIPDDLRGFALMISKLESHLIELLKG